MDDVLIPGAPAPMRENAPAVQNAPVTKTKSSAAPVALADLLTAQKPISEENPSAVDLDSAAPAVEIRSSPFHLSHRALHGILLGGASILTILGALIFRATSDPVHDFHPVISAESGAVELRTDRNIELQVSDDPYSISSAVTIATKESSSAVVSFPDNGEIRIQPKTTLEIGSSDASSSITLNSGAVWVTALDTFEIETADYRFVVNSGAASFARKDGKILVSAWDNTLPIEVRTQKNEEDFAFTLPILTSAIFPEDPQEFFGEDTLQKLRFSKLQKEFHMTRAMATSEEKYELRRDAELRARAADRLLNSSNSGRTLFAGVASLLTFFPEQKAEDQYRDEKARVEELYQAATAHDRSQADALLRIGFSQPLLEKIAADLTVLETFLPVKTLRAQVEDLLLSSPESSPVRTEAFLRNALHGLQKALSTGNAEWRDLELKRIRILWDRIRKDQTSSVEMLVPSQRETIFHLLLEYPTAASAEILSFAEDLDTIAVALAPEAEKNLVRQENIDRKFATAKALIQVEMLPLARALTEQAQAQLTELGLSTSSEGLKNLAKQEQNIMVRIYACNFNTTCSDNEFARWYQTKKLSACQLFTACTPEAFTQWLQDLLSGKVATETNPPEAVPANDFAAAKSLLEAADITLERGRQGSEGFFLIERATTENGITFSGELAIEDAYLRNVQLTSGTALPGTIALSSLTAVLTRAEQPTHLPDTVDSNNAGGPSSPLDPVLSDLTIRTLQPELLDAGFVVLRSDIVPESTSLVHVLQAVVGTEQIAVSFDYRISKESQERTLERIKLEAFPEMVLRDLPLEVAQEEIIRIFRTADSAAKLQNEAWQLFTTAGFLIEKRNIIIGEQANTVHFTGLQDLHHGFVFTGEFAVPTQIFLRLSDSSKNWQRINISLEEYPQLFAADESEQEMRNVSPDSKSAAEAALEEDAQ